MSFIKAVKTQQKEEENKTLLILNQLMKINQKDTQSKQGQTQKRFLQSLFVCTGIITQLLQNMERQLPPHTQRVLTYSRLMMNKATQKIVGINLLESEYFNNFTVNEDQYQSSSEFQQISLENQKNKVPIKEDDLTNSYYYPNKLTSTHQGKVSSPKLVQDKQIVLKKSGIKFTKKQDLRNLIKHKSSNAYSSFHSSFNPTYQIINTKHSLYQSLNQKRQNLNFHPQSSPETQYLNQTIIKSSSLKQSLQIQQKNGINSRRISNRMNSNRFVNIDQYYQQKNNQHKRNNNKTLFKGNSLQLDRNNNKQNQTLLRKNNNSYHPTWPYRQSQSKDQDDIVINKLRERKLKFYKAQNNSNEDLFSNQKAKKTINESQKDSQKDQFGAMKAFDYNGSVMPTVKYGSLKISSHYQDMQIQVTNNDESLLKRKRERKGYILGGGINLKLVDHQRFIPHPKYNNDPLIQKQGILMKQNIGYLLKKGVSLRPKQENSVNSCSISGFNDQQQTQEKINKSNFQFLNNQQIEPKNVKFQQFIKYKKLPLPSNKSIASKKRIVDQAFLWEESLLSKKSISVKGQKSKTLIQDSSNKVHKSTNAKAFQMLINHNQMNSNPINTVHFQKSQVNGLITPPDGVLKKSPINKMTSQEIESKLPKKKVRIA